MHLLRKWCRSTGRCFRYMGTPAERRSPCLGVLSIRTALQFQEGLPTGTVARTGEAFHTPATTTSRCRRPASTTTSAPMTPRGPVFRWTPDFKLHTRTHAHIHTYTHAHTHIHSLSHTH